MSTQKGSRRIKDGEGKSNAEHRTFNVEYGTPAVPGWCFIRCWMLPPSHEAMADQGGTKGRNKRRTSNIQRPTSNMDHRQAGKLLNACLPQGLKLSKIGYIYITFAGKVRAAASAAAGIEPI